MNLFARLIVTILCLIAVVKTFNLEVESHHENKTYEIRGGL